MGSIKIPIETSARHIHISREDFEKLFGEGKELTFVKELSQPGQYLAKERITIAGPRGTFENVAILGPFRKETQVELSLTDTRKIGVPGVIRQSGDVDGIHLKISKKGNRHLRCLLYLGASCNYRLKKKDQIYLFNQKKRQQSQSPLKAKAANIAAAHKLLTIIYALSKSGELYRS